MAGDSTVTTDSGSFTLKDVSSTGDIVAGLSPDFGGVSEPIGQWEIIDSSNVEQNFDFDGLSYTTVDMPDGEVQVTGRAPGNTDTDIVIPATVTSNGITYSVTTIGDRAFYNNALTSVIIPVSVTTIEDFAFFDNALTSVTIGNSVTSIGKEAFAFNALTSAAFKGGFGDFPPNMFDANPTLATITYCEGTSGWPQGFNNGSTIIVTTEMPCSTAVDAALIWLLLRPQVLEEE